MRAGNDEIIKCLISEMVYEQIKDIDLDYEKVVNLKTVELIKDVYNELMRNIPDDIKLTHLYKMFDEAGMLVSLDIYSEEKLKSDA